MNTETKQDKVVLRKPGREDAAKIWQLIRNCPPLDVNSSYAYLLLTEHFAGTCVVAELEGKVVGCVTGYVPPEQPKTLFVWQVAVDGAARGIGLGRRMIMHILSRPACKGVDHLETTVSPGNEASRRMFQGVARALETELHDMPFFEAHLLAEEGHEPEDLLKIGPFGPVTTS